LLIAVLNRIYYTKEILEFLRLYRKIFRQMYRVHLMKYKIITWNWTRTNKIIALWCHLMTPKFFLYSVKINVSLIQIWNSIFKLSINISNF